MSRGGLCHQLFGSDIVKGNFQQRIAAHFHDRQYHTPAESSMLDHITLVHFQISGSSLRRGKHRSFTAFDLLTDHRFLREAPSAKLVIPVCRSFFPLGKTAFAVNIAQNLAVYQHKKVALFSLEMSGEQLVTRMLSSQASISSHALRSGTLTNDEWINLAAAADELSKAPILIDDTAGISVAEMKAKLRRVRDLGAVFIDYLQLMNSSGKRTDNRVLEVSEITRSLKVMAKELNVPVVVCSQLSRGPESRTDHRPMLSDLRESGSIEQDADIVMFLYREGYYKEDADPNLAECIVAKNRHGETDKVPLSWNGPYSRFGTLDIFSKEQ